MTAVSRSALTLFLVSSTFACQPETDRATDYLESSWTSEEDFRIGDAMAGSALFSRVPYLRVSPDGSRVFVVEPREASVTVWSPEGSLLLALGGSGQGPGDFMGPYKVHIEENGFYVRDRQRFSLFSSAGDLLRTIPGPPTLARYQGFLLRADAVLTDGTYLGVPEIPAHIMLGMWGDDPFDELPLLRVEQSSGEWSVESFFSVDARNGILGIEHPDGAAEGIQAGAQPFGDADLYEFDPGTETVVVVRRNRNAGLAEVIEVSAAGDTVWRRELRLEPVELPAATAEEAVEARVESFREGEELSYAAAREAVEDALYVPEFYPSVERLRLASSGQVWLRSWERFDTLRAWYSIGRGDMESAPRRVLLPEWLDVMDGTESHVWGVWLDPLDINYVVGRRLVPPGT